VSDLRIGLQAGTESGHYEVLNVRELLSCKERTTRRFTEVDKDNDIQIELGQSVRRHIESKKSPLKDGAHVAAPYGSPKEDQIPVFVAESVMRAIERHAASQKDKEIGGVLLGGFFRSDEGSFVEVTDSIEAKGAEGTDVSLTFTHDTWEQINADQSRRAPESEIVGWYHSHPALGVFMSKEDEFIHASYFADPWHVALVVDPTYHNWGCFKWRDGALERTGGFYVFGEKKAARRVKEYGKRLTNARQPAPRAASASADRTDFAADRQTTALWAVIGLLFVLQVAIAFVAFLGRHAPGDGADYMKAANELLEASDLRGAELFLTTAVLRHAGNEDAFKRMQELQVALSDPEVQKLDNDRLDRVNFALYAADERARIRPETRGRPWYKELGDIFSRSEDKSASIPNAATPACEAYVSAASTLPPRRQRAEKVRDALLASPAFKGKKEEYTKNTWFVRAVARLKEEHLWEMAYALESDNENRKKEYGTTFKSLGSSDQDAVRRFRSAILAHRPRLSARQ
jgi:proteasome lid subunit RPN8/RPN11